MKMPGGGTEPGEPELPAMRYFFIIPPDRDVTSVTVISFNEHDLKGNFIVFPTQEDRPTTEEPPPEIWSEPKSEIYSSSTPFPGEIVRIMQHGYLDGGTRIVSISVSPLRYIPDMGVLRLVDNITFTLNLGGSSSQPSVPAVRHTKDQKVYDSILDGLVLNPEDMATWQQKPTLQNSYSFVTQDHFFPYVIITAPEFAPQMEEFVQWKRTKGIYAGVVTTDWIYANYTGDEVSGIYDEAGKLRAYLQDAWQNYGTCWVLLAGDETHLPLRYGYRTWNYSSNYSEYIIPTDFYFSDYNSNWDDDHGRWGLNIAEIDPWPETFIGRIPIGSTTEFRDWYDKQRLYVDDPGNGDPAYLNKVLLTQEDQMQWEATYAPDGQAGIIAANHLSANFIPEILEEDLGPCIDPTSPHGSDLVDKLDEGFGIVTHNNHGSGISITVGTGEGWELVTHPNGDTVSVYHCYTWSPWWGFKREWSTNGTSSGFNHLAETDRYSFVYSIGCNNATFDDELTPNEGHLDWAGPSFSEMYLENYRKGAIAFAGNTRYGKVFSSFNLEKRFFDLITNWGNYGDFPHTKAGVAEGVHKAANADWYLLYSHNLFGDPELDIWNNTPLLFTNVTYSAFMVGPLEYSVQTNIPYSTVSISKPDEDYYESTLTGADGIAVFQVNFATDDDFYLQVTKHNYIPYHDGHFPCAPSAPAHPEIRAHEGTVLLRWDRSPQWDVQSYTVYRKTIPDPEFPKPVWRNIGSTSENTFHDLGFAPNPEGGTVAYYLIKAHDTEGYTSPSSSTVSTQGWLGIMKPVVGNLPKVFKLTPVFPNPFNAATSVQFNLPVDGFIELQVYDMAGNQVKTLVSGEKAAGAHVVSWQGDNDRGQMAASGVYHLVLTATEAETGKQHRLLQKAILLK